MQALGLIETRGTLAAIEAADAMMKAADVSLLQESSYRRRSGDHCRYR